MATPEGIPNSFENSLPNFQRKIKKYAVTYKKISVSHRMDVGLMLQDLRDAYNGTELQPSISSDFVANIQAWFEDESLTRQRIREYICVYEIFGTKELKDWRDKMVWTAMVLLIDNQDAIDEAIEYVKLDRKLDTKKAKELLAKHKPETMGAGIGDEINTEPGQSTVSHSPEEPQTTVCNSEAIGTTQSGLTQVDSGADSSECEVDTVIETREFDANLFNAILEERDYQKLADFMQSQPAERYPNMLASIMAFSEMEADEANDELRAENQRLKAENEDLKAQLEKPGSFELTNVETPRQGKLMQNLGFEDQFEILWGDILANGPKGRIRTKKPEAKKAFISHAKKYLESNKAQLFPLIREQLGQYLSTADLAIREDGKYCPLFSTLINGEFWEEDPTDWVGVGSTADLANKARELFGDDADSEAQNEGVFDAEFTRKDGSTSSDNNPLIGQRI